MTEDLDTAAAVRQYLGEQQRTDATANIAAAAGGSGELEAELRAASQRTGVPISSARAMPEVVKRRAEVDSTQEALQRFPSTMAFMAQDGNARIAHDDVGVLSKVESAIGGIASYVMGADNRGGLPGDLGAGVFRASRGAAGAFQAGAEMAAPLFENRMGYGSQRNVATDLAGWFAQQGKTAEAKAKDLAGSPTGILQGGVSSGVQSFVQNALVLPLGLAGAGPAAVTGIMSIMAGGQSYQKAREKEVPVAGAAVYAASDAAIEFATERIPVGRLFGDLKAGTPTFATLARQIGAEVPGEQVATVLQDLNEWAVLNPDKPFSAYLKERPSAAAQTLIATVIGSGGNVMVMKAVQDTLDKTAGIDRGAERMAEVMKAAAESRLRERDPVAFADFVDKAVADGQAPSEVYVDARAFADALNQSGITPEQVAAALPSIASQIADAATAGGDLVIPLGEFAAGIAGSPLEQVLMQHVRTTPEALSQAESKEADRQAGATMQAADAATAETDAQAGYVQVRDQILEQLNAAARFTEDVNRAYADMTASFYAATAQRLGITPMDLLQRQPVNIRAEGVAPAGLDQAAYHGTPHRGIDQFSTDKIGTGEGAQAFGWGLYFASNQAIAEHYRKVLSYRDVVRQFRDALPDDADLDEALEAANKGELPEPMADVVKALAADDWLGFDYPSQAITAAFKELENYDASPGLKEAVKNYGGQLYKVEIPEDNTMLAWDQPLSEQPDVVRRALEGGELTNATGQNILEMDPTGEAIYRAASRMQGGDEGASNWLAEFGIRGIRYLDGNSRTAKAGTYNYVVFDGADAAITEQFYQDGADTVRGQYAPSARQITLLAKADLSTFLHESGHLYLDTLSNLAAEPDAPADVVADMQKVLDWFGVADLATWRAMTLDQQREHHEKFARGFEAYLFEGQAPSAGLRAAFGRFRAWLTSVYRSVRALGVELNPEVRGVFDRLLATEAEIQQAEAARNMVPMFKTAADAGMTDAEFAAYQALGADATQQAVDNLQRRSMRDMQWLANARNRALKALQKAARERRKEIEAEVAREVDDTPLQRARVLLREAGKTNPEVKAAIKEWTALRDQQAGIVREDVKQEYLAAEPGLRGLAKGQYLAKQKRAIDNEAERRMLDWERANPRPIRPKNVADMDVIAEATGFTSGDHLAKELDAAPSRADTIEALTDQRMLERYGELADPQAIERAANEAVHNDARARFIATEAAALQAAVEPARKKGQPRVLLAAAKQYAAGLIGRKKVAEVKPAQFVAAEARAAREAERGKDVVEKATAKRNQLLNHELARAANEALDDIEAGVRYLRKFEKEGVRSSLATDYVDQIDALLERYDLRKGTTLADIARRQSLADWVEAQREMGVEPDIPKQLLDGIDRRSYKELSVDEFRGLVETVKQVEHLGRLKEKLLTAKDQRAFDAVREEIVAGIVANGQGRSADTRTPNTLPGEALVKLKRFWASHIKAATWARVMDGGKDGGPAWEYLIRSANEAGDRETGMREKATKELSALVTPVLKAGAMGGKGTFFPSIGRSLNREARLAIALNWGNDGNRQRLLGGEGWNEAQLAPVLASITAQEWAFVQKVWDYFESYRPQIAAKEKRVYGREPQWVEPVAFDVQLADGSTASLRGGYYPIKYDPRASERAESHSEAEEAKQMMRAAYTSATTRRSFTKSRAEEVSGRPLLYSLDGIYNGVQEVIHDLSWHEWLIDANRLVKNKSISAAIRNTYGPEVHQQFKQWLQDIAVGDKPAQGAGEAAAAWVRQGVSVAGLGFNVMSALMQPLGFTQSMVRIGPQWVGRGIAKAIGSPIDTTRQITEMSTFMRTRFMTRLREINEVRNQVKGQGAVRRGIDGAAYALMLRMQQVVDVPTWWGAYEKAIGQGQDQERAVALADQAVIDAQGSGMSKDLAGIERGGPALKLFTVFYSFFNTTLNLGVGQTMTEQNKAKLAADYLLLFTVPALLGGVLKDALTPGDAGDDPDKLLRKLLGEQLSFLFGLMVWVRELGSPLTNIIKGEGFGTDYSGPAGVRMFGDVVKLAKQLEQGEADDGLRKAIINLAGDLLRLPAAQMNRTITGAQALANGKTDNPAALVLGYQEP